MATVDKKELRIGNLVYGTKENEEDETDRFLCRVMGVDETSSLGDGWTFLVEGLEETEITFYDYFEPIRLRLPHLKKLGFEYLRHKDGTRGVYSNGKMNLILSNSGNVYNMRNKLIPYVHTLQNHYYFSLLTGEELTIKYN